MDLDSNNEYVLLFSACRQAQWKKITKNIQNSKFNTFKSMSCGGHKSKCTYAFVTLKKFGGLEKL
jgi:hypothetical protein